MVWQNSIVLALLLIAAIRNDLAQSLSAELPSDTDKEATVETKRAIASGVSFSPLSQVANSGGAPLNTDFTIPSTDLTARDGLSMPTEMQKLVASSASQESVEHEKNTEHESEIANDSQPNVGPNQAHGTTRSRTLTETINREDIDVSVNGKNERQFLSDPVFTKLVILETERNDSVASSAVSPGHSDKTAISDSQSSANQAELNEIESPALVKRNKTDAKIPAYTTSNTTAVKSITLLNSTTIQTHRQLNDTKSGSGNVAVTDALSEEQPETVLEYSSSVTATVPVLIGASATVCQCGPNTECTSASLNRKCACDALRILSNGKCDLHPTVKGLIISTVLSLVFVLFVLLGFVVLARQRRGQHSELVYEMR